jgi:uncharacterized protein YlxP (DUF503 family)
LAYAKTLNDKDMVAAAEVILQRRKNDEAMSQSIAMRSADREGQKREAEERLKLIEESGEEELIEAAKAQLKAAGAPDFGADPEKFDRETRQKAQETLSKIGSFFEVSLPPYKNPGGSDIV